MDKPASDSPHRIAQGAARRLAGLGRRYTMQTRSAIPALWQEFVPYLGHIAAQTGPAFTTYGVCYNPDASRDFDYLCAVEVTPGASLPEGFITLDLAAHTYAVFPHAGPLPRLNDTWNAIWGRWIPDNDLKVIAAPFFELYGPDFDPDGEGGLDIWIPVQS